MPSSVLAAPVLSSLTFTPSNLQSGDSSTGTVTFDSVAPAGGLTVALSSSDPVAVIPATVVIPEGAAVASFTLTTRMQGFLSVPTISASFDGTTVSATLFVGPSSSLSQIALLSGTAVDGGVSTFGEAALGNLAPIPSGVVVALSSSNPALAAVPATVTIAYGATFANFPITTTAVSRPTVVTISGTYPASITRSVLLTLLPPSNAAFDATLGVPRCVAVDSFCDTGASLVNGRADIAGGPESNAPNTINGSCSDGTAGTFHASESLDRLRIWSVDGNPLAAGRLVQIDAHVWNGSSQDELDVFFAPDALNPVWTLIATVPMGGDSGVPTVLSAPFTLPPGPLPAIRGNWRKLGTPGPCTSGAFDDRDDLVFAVGAPVNATPSVNAGPDQTITMPAVATMAGTATDDGLPGPPATLNTTWSVVTGPGTVTFGDATGLQTTAAFSAAGSYVLRLTASDGSLSASDDLVVTVNPPLPVNQPPLVNAGDDQTVTLPAAAGLMGNVSDDGLPSPPAAFTTTWSKVSGPGTVTFEDANAASTTAVFSAAGAYVLRLTATDSALSASDTVAITVKPRPPNMRPTVNAGPDITLTLPASTTLNGSASDDGLPDPPGAVTTTWSKVSGPGKVTLANASALATRASFSSAGTYVLRLRASDSVLSSTDELTVMVKAGPMNAAPVVNAGPDLTLTLPASATLNGSASDDGRPNPPGAVTTTWSKVSGPGTVAFAHASARTTTATFSAAGTYVVKLTASDGALSGSDTAQVIVAAPTPCAGLCSNPVAFTVSGRFQSGNLGTGTVCYQTTTALHGGNCGNFVSPRTLKVNGVTESCNGANWASVPAPRNGGYCIQTTAGNQSFAFFTAF